METKEQIRKQGLENRDHLSLEERSVADQIRNSLILEWDVYQKAERIWLYASFRSEADTFLLMDQVMKAHGMVGLPRVESFGIMNYYEVKRRDDLTAGAFHIPEPDPLRCRRFSLIEDCPDIVFVPGAVFDCLGHRIGYGGGYYDRYFSSDHILGLNKSRPLLAALCYDCQVLDRIPFEDHDIRMDVIITESRIIDCRIKEK